MNILDKLPPRPTMLRAAAILSGLAVIFALLMTLYTLAFVAPNLPGLDTLLDYNPKIPLRIYTADNVLIGEFGEEHRDFVPIGQMPLLMKQAVVAIEDERFYSHGALDFRTLIGAVVTDIATLSLARGASTITMQVARNFLLTKKKTADRKLTEILLAYKIEAGLSKDQILELYMNQIYLGQRSNGFSGAAAIYFGKSLNDLSLAEIAMLAGLPQAPTAHNPVVNFGAAKERQQLVLKRMLDQGLISAAAHDAAVLAPLTIRSGGQEYATHAEYAAETVRREIVAQYKEEAYTRGIKVYTTLLSKDQNAAYESLRRNVMQYDQRHGYRGPEAAIDLPSDKDEREQAIDDALSDHPASDKLLSALVLSADASRISARLLSGDVIEITGDGLRFAASGLSPSASSKLKIRPGSLIRVTADAKNHWSVTQLPEVSAAFVSLDANTGAYRALVGGFDFNLAQFNHVTQAWRQPGSTMKPFIYSAALDKGYVPATLIDDAPLSLSGADTGGQAWEPRNDDGRFDGPMPLRTALAKSKNVVAVRLLRAITPQYAREFISRFGFERTRQPLNLTLALGTGSVTPQQMAAGYAVFANGGYKVTPYLIQKVVDGQGQILSQARTPAAGRDEARVLDARNAYITDSLLREVVRSGTGAAATQKLGRYDLAGKTGTTSDSMDGWFAGYGGNVVAVAWMGYDDPRSLGGREFGATLSLPIWIDYMRTALAGVAPGGRAMPAGVSVTNGELAYAEFGDGRTIKSLDAAGTTEMLPALAIAPPPDPANVASPPASVPAAPPVAAAKPPDAGK